MGCGRAWNWISKYDKRAFTFACKLKMSVSHLIAAPLFSLPSERHWNKWNLSAARSDNGDKGRGQLETLSWELTWIASSTSNNSAAEMLRKSLSYASLLSRVWKSKVASSTKRRKLQKQQLLLFSQRLHRKTLGLRKTKSKIWANIELINRWSERKKSCETFDSSRNNENYFYWFALLSVIVLIIIGWIYASSITFSIFVLRNRWWMRSRVSRNCSK